MQHFIYYVSTTVVQIKILLFRVHIVNFHWNISVFQHQKMTHNVKMFVLLNFAAALCALYCQIQRLFHLLCCCSWAPAPLKVFLCCALCVEVSSGWFACAGCRHLASCAACLGYLAADQTPEEKPWSASAAPAARRRLLNLTVLVTMSQFTGLGGWAFSLCSACRLEPCFNW